MTQLDQTPATPPPPGPPTTDDRAGKPRRPRIVWVFAALGILLFLIGGTGNSYQSKLQDVQKNDNSSFLPASADSTKVNDAAQKFDKVQTIPGFVVYHRDGTLTATDKAKISADAQKFRGLAGVASDQVGLPQYSKDGKVAAVSVPLVGKSNGKSVKGPTLVDNEKRILKTARTGLPSGLAVSSAGAGGLLVAFIDAFGGLSSSLLFSALGVVIVILLLVYRSPVLWIYPLLSAGIALGTASLVIYGLAKSGAITLNGQSASIFEVLVIGAGTDYALLLISRYREELHQYESRTQAMIVAWKGAAPPIGASAITVILGLICLTFADLNSTASLGPVCAIAIAATVLVMLTLLPLLLVISGRWIFWPRRPSVDHQGDIATHGMWGRFAGSVTAHSRRNWALGSVLLVACAIAVIGLKSGGISTSQGFTNKPDAVKGQNLYDQAFPQNKGAGAPADILVNASKSDDVIAAVKKVDGVAADQVCVQPDYAKLAALAKQNPGGASSSKRFTGCAPPSLQVQPIGGKLILNAVLTSSFDSQDAYRTVERIRTAAGKVSGADALVGGSSATNLDIQNASRHDRNLIIPIVLLVILIVLGVVLRALFAPLILIVSVVVSFLAALGVSALFFNHVFHFANADPSFPLFAFVFLVALGIDYNIFLMTRVREETLQYGTRDGIKRGLSVTGGVITSAGVVLAATFVVLAVVPIVFLAEVGFTVAFGVLLDTILVRSIVVPALSHDIGKKIWWPSKLARAGAAD